MEIKNKVAIVTGGIGGIGLVTVQHLIKNKIQFVAILDLPESNSEVVIKNLNKLKITCGEENYEYYSCDIRDTQQFRAIYDKIIASKKYVDILISAAGIMNENNIDLCIDVNLKAALNSATVAIEYMRKDKGGKGGVIVNVASIAGILNFSLYPIYCTTKHALVAFTRSSKMISQVLGIRVVCICPSITRTNMTDLSSLHESCYDWIDPKLVDDLVKGFQYQSPDNVAVAIIEIILKGDAGAVWMVENNEPPYAIREILDIEELRIDFSKET